MNRRNFIGMTSALGAFTVLKSQAVLATETNSGQLSKGNPLMKGVHHVGISTSDLDRSLHFYGELLGIEILGKGSFAGDAYTNITGLKNARGRMAMLRIGNTRVEVFEFEQAKGRATDLQRPVSAIGFNHLCFEVTDVYAEYQRLKQAGVAFHSDPQLFGKAKAVYGRDPDGNVFELVQW